MEPRCSRLVLPALLGQASSPCSSALSIQCDAVQHCLILKCSKVRQHSLRPGDKSCTFLWKWNKLIGWRGVHTLPLSYHLTLCYSNGLLNSHEIKWKRTYQCLSAILHMANKQRFWISGTWDLATTLRPESIPSEFLSYLQNNFNHQKPDFVRVFENHLPSIF